MMFKQKIKDFRFIGICILVVISLIIVYGNHFDNGFYFDDKHTIVNNNSIKEINVHNFFTDNKTFSSLPGNQPYRPLTTLDNAIDYTIGKGLNPKAFHIHIFSTFILLGIAIYFLAFSLLKEWKSSKYNKYYALLTSAIFCFLCANTQAVNYIIQRAEITAALFVILGLIFYIKDSFLRRSYLYLLFPFIGFFTKEMALIFPFLLFLYILIYEEKVYLFGWKNKENLKGFLSAVKKSALAFILMFIFYFAIYKPLVSETYVTSDKSAFLYFITQPMVIIHYIITYFIPYDLSIDSDWKLYTSIWDYKVILGFLINFLILFATIRLSKHHKYRLFSFGILWFYITLAPTSTIIPFSEVMNDHRAFLPYVGLTFSFFSVIYLAYEKLKRITSNKNAVAITSVFLFVFFTGNIYGIRKRNIVWNNEYNLWKDNVEKSPNNARGLMNLGVNLMRRAQYKEAEKYFKQALKISPNYNYIHINLSIIENLKGNTKLAEQYLNQALNLKTDYITLYFYADFLKKNKRFKEAEEKLLHSIQLSDTYPQSLNLLQEVYKETSQNEKLKVLVNRILKNDPNNLNANRNLNWVLNKEKKIIQLEKNIADTPSPEKYLELSLMYYNHKEYEKAKDASLNAIKLNPNYAEAYNNLGISNFMLNNYFETITAYEKAISLNPNYQLAKNNLANAVKSKSKFRDFYINESLKFYNNGAYNKCIIAAQKSIDIEPSSAAYNNICSAYNQLKQYNAAITACEKAIDLDKTNKFAKGNLNFAKSKLEN